MPRVDSGPADPIATTDPRRDSFTSSQSAAIESAVEVIESEFASFLAHEDRVASSCDVLRQHDDLLIAPTGADWLAKLLPLPGKRVGAIALLLSGWFEEMSRRHPDPWPIFVALLSARDSSIQVRALELIAGATTDGRLKVDDRVVESLAEKVSEEGSALTTAAALATIAHIVEKCPAGCEELLVSGSTSEVKRLAGRLLDLDRGLPSGHLAERLLGADAAGRLRPYLAFTCATHGDLLDAQSLAADAASLRSFCRAEEACGERVLCDVVAALGWARINQGIEARHYVGISALQSYPLLADAREARLFDGCPDVRRVFERTLIVAAGRAATDEKPGAGSSDLVARFRASNVIHAELLGEILDVAPLTRVRLARVLDRTGRLVADFAALFGESTDRRVRDEVAEISRIHSGLVERIGAELEATGDDPLPMDVCRLVQPFEDPASPGEIRTLHGLKRFLHQRGLALAFGLIGTGPRTTHTVDMAIVSAGRVVEVGRHIEFIDLEGETCRDPAPAIPYQVRIVADAIAAQLLHGIRIQPHIRVFCYGHEVHYFARFRNHPAFIRIDFSPPLRGGMIDLQYAGVSINDLSVHPCPSLDAIRTFFERLDFIVSVDSTRIQARYDKERAVTIEDLHRRASILFHLLPYLMDVDWTIGSLQINESARHLVVDAWSGFFARWGVLPMEEFLTSDRGGILVEAQVGAEGAREVRWTGRAPYADRFTSDQPDAVAEELGRRLAALGIESSRPVTSGDLAGQFSFADRVLGPLRAALDRGELEETTAGLARRGAALFEREHESDRFVTILDSDLPLLAQSAYLAQAVPLLERHVRFRTTGSINGYLVQQARVSIGSGAITIFALRDGDGLARLAFAAGDDCLWHRRDRAGDQWQENGFTDMTEVIDRLRRANVLGSVPVMETGDAVARAAELRRLFRVPRPGSERRASAGERIVPGVIASPGRIAGLARLGIGGWRRDALDGAILVAAGLEPSDAPCLFQAAGIVATGGGILSHLGLLAVESGKPALIIEAAWDRLQNGEAVLRFSTCEYDERAHDRGAFSVKARHHVREADGLIHDGDLLVLDAHQGTLTALGHDATVLAQYESLRLLAGAALRLARCTRPEDTLAARGQHLRAMHQVEKTTARISSPAHARFAVEETVDRLIGRDSAESSRDGIAVLEWLVANPAAGRTAIESIRHTIANIAGRLREARDRATSLIPSSTSCHDVLALRLHVVHLHETLKRVTAALDCAGMDPGVVGVGDQRDVDSLALSRLHTLGEDLVRRLDDQMSRGGEQSRLVELDRLAGLLAVEAWSTAVRRRADAKGGRRGTRRTILTARDGGLELAGVLGPKAANLAEVGRIVGATAVPDWFAVTDLAFERVYTPELSGRIDQILTRDGLDAGGQAAAIRDVWANLSLPPDLSDSITRAYRALGYDCLVAVRSSAAEEDLEQSTRAGQFDTFLFVRGEASLIEHVKLVWSSLWTERAIAMRAMVEARPLRPRCGVIVQRMVRSRVSGVLQTINAAESKPRELVINVGLGLGEGVVSGAVAADHIVVSKHAGDDGALRFRYMTADKRERVVFDERFGRGTVRVATLAHQRLRPALEYPELRELVDTGIRLEHAYGHPIDMEFAFEGAALYVLQVRPVPASLAVWHETTERYPLVRSELRMEVLS